MQAQGMTQATLAAATGIPKSTISRYTNGVSSPRKSQLPLLAVALCCTVDALTGGEAPEPDPDYEHDVPVPVAAKLLGRPEQFVRNALIQGTAPFGFAVKGEGRYSFHISPHKLAEYTGKVVAGT